MYQHHLYVYRCERTGILQFIKKQGKPINIKLRQEHVLCGFLQNEIEHISLCAVKDTEPTLGMLKVQYETTSSYKYIQQYIKKRQSCLHGIK